MSERPAKIENEALRNFAGEKTIPHAFKRFNQLHYKIIAAPVGEMGVLFCMSVGP